MIWYRREDKPSTSNRQNNQANKHRFQATRVGSTKAKVSKTNKDTATTHTRHRDTSSPALITTVVSRPCPSHPLLPPHLGSATVPRITLTETRTDAIQARFRTDN